MSDIQDTIAQIKAEAESASPFKLHQQVRACRPKSFNLLTGQRPHDCTDPKQHFDTRVVGWDSLGRVLVGVEFRGSNPHCHSWCWSDNMLKPTDRSDWFFSDTHTRPLRKIGDMVFFMWEETGWSEQTVGDIIPAVLVCPHIDYRDWIVSYRVPSDGRWITRVVNELQMWDRTEEIE